MALDLEAVRAAVAGDTPVLLVGAAFGARIAMRATVMAGPRAVGLVVFGAGLGAPPSAAECGAAAVIARRERRRLSIPEAPAVRGCDVHLDDASARRSARAAWSDPAGLALWRRVRVPTIVAAGAHDPNVESSRRIAAALPDATFEIMAASGHAVVLERPAEARALVERMLAVVAHDDRRSTLSPSAVP